MVEGLAAQRGCLDENPQVGDDLLLPREVIKSQRAQGPLYILVGACRSGGLAPDVEIFQCLEI